MSYLRVAISLGLVAVIGGCTLAAATQQTNGAEVSTTPSTNGTVVPQLVNYSGVLTDANGKALSGVVGVTFALYQESEGGSPLWTEIQNVQMGKGGHYSVILGSTTSAGVPEDVFATGQARWLGVQAEGQAEQPRVLLVAVPYALKAGDAETVGGFPPSAFVMANVSDSRKNSAPTANPDVTGVGTVDYIPMWDQTSDIIDSIIFQKSSQIGLNTTTPAATLDVNGKTDIRNTLTLYPDSTNNTLAVNGTSFKVSSTGEVTFISGQTYPGAGTITGITTASGSGLSGGGTTGTLSLKVPSAGITNAMLADSKITLNASTAGGLTVPGAMTLGDTYTIGLKTCSTNQVLQYNGTAWGCATISGTGTITGVTAGTDLTGGGTSGTVTLNLNTAKVPVLASANIFTANQTFNDNAQVIGDTRVDYDGLNGGSTSPGIRFGTGNTGEGISSDRTGTVNGNGIDFYTDFAPRLSVTNAGLVGIGTQTPAYALDVNGTGNFVGGINISTTQAYGINSLGSYQGGLFSGPGGGSFSQSGTESDFATGAYGIEYGTSSETVGVYGSSASQTGAGVYGQDVEASKLGGAIYPEAGVWGDSGSTDAFGVLGTTDDGNALVGENNSNTYSTLYLSNFGTGGTGTVLQAVGNNGTCAVDVNGNFGCTGGVAAVAALDGGGKKVALSAVHSAEDWFEDAGSGQLSGGAAVVNIDSMFGETVNTGVEYHVFLTPNGDCKGLYVAQKSAASFVVRELGGGTSSIGFDYRIMAKRKGFEQVRLADRTQTFSAENHPVRKGGKQMPNGSDVRKQVLGHMKPQAVAAGAMAISHR